MKEENKNLFSQEVFVERIRQVMDMKSITLEDLHKEINSFGYDISKSNLSLYIQRTPNVNFLIALSKALSVPLDYLVGLSDNLYMEGFDYRFQSKRYKKYCGTYFFYFLPTVSNSSAEVNTASLVFDDSSPDKVELTIQIDEENIKKYTGNFLLSSTYKVGYIVLKEARVGECVFLSFFDPTINSDTNIKLLVGAMLSVSSGDFKRVPVMSRFVLSRSKVPEDKLTDIHANLRLNSKYVLITEEKLAQSIADIGISSPQKDTVLERLVNAFSKKVCFSIEESYILNTLKNDCNLTTAQSLVLLDTLRINSFSDANSKINGVIDARMYNYIFDSLV
jgi:transcriptional regulator with XRE-family HTH domain